MADENNYLFSFHLQRRSVEEPEKPSMFRSAREEFHREDLTPVNSEPVVTLSLGMCAPLESNKHVVVADRFFGGLNFTIELQQRGIDSAVKCRSNRPTEVWEALENEQPNKFGYSIGQFIGDNGFPIHCYRHSHSPM